MTKSYQDGIIDAINIVSYWKNIGIQPSIINSILEELNGLLSTPEQNISNKTITNDPKKSQEVGGN